MPQYYVLAIPQTVQSLIQYGRLPNKKSGTSSTEEKTIYCYQSYKECIAATPTNLHQSFLLCVEIKDASLKVIKTHQIDITCIQSVLVYSERGKKTLLNLLKGVVPVKICISPDLYPEEKQAPKSSAPSSNPVRLVSGDILNSSMQTLINTVNCVGVMGKGISLGFKKKYPEMFKDYKKKCNEKQVRLGVPYIHKIPQGKWIVNFPTKDHWKKNSDLKDIENGLSYLVSQLKTWGVTSLAVPPLGCTNGGLKWADVFPLIQKYLYPTGILLEIYTPPKEMKEKKDKTYTNTAHTSFSFAATKAGLGSQVSSGPALSAASALKPKDTKTHKAPEDIKKTNSGNSSDFFSTSHKRKRSGKTTPEPVNKTNDEKNKHTSKKLKTETSKLTFSESATNSSTRDSASSSSSSASSLSSSSSSSSASKVSSTPNSALRPR
jgi:O-acetyl-ADP-ribose deacetylase (regulator of RNase III)